MIPAIANVVLMLVVALLAALVGYLAVRVGALNTEQRRLRQSIERVHCQLDRRDNEEARTLKDGGDR